MSSSSAHRSMRLWTCCKCREVGISMTVVDCPNCQQSRCYDCDVKSHAATDVDIQEEEMKVDRMTGQRGSHADETEPARTRHGGPSFPRIGSEQSNVAFSSREAFETSGLASVASNFDSGAYITTVPSGTNDPIYIMNTETDATLIGAWQTALRDISRSCFQTQLPLTSIHLFRMGPTQEMSSPTIIVNTTKPLDSVSEEVLRNLIIDTIYPRGTELPPLQLMIKQSRLRRSIDSSHSTSLPPICEPRNREFHIVPSTGDSIGIGGSKSDTASLGCYLMVGPKVVALTVDHLIPGQLANPALTHISEQDRECLLVPRLNAELRLLLVSSDHRCNHCIRLQCSTLQTTNPITENRLAEYRMIVSSSATTPRCDIFEELNTFLHEHCSQYRSRPLGKFVARSWTRPRELSFGILREMDWALFEVLPSHSQHFFLWRRQTVFQGPDVPFFTTSRHIVFSSAINPGAFVKSRGRTSGYQSGQLSTTPSLVFHESYVTEEWCVLKRPETPLNEWVEGGIGVDGDSGALIVDEEKDTVYGMLWGRTGEGAATVTIFTPMEEIVQDIEAQTAEKVGYVTGQVLDTSPTDERIPHSTSVSSILVPPPLSRPVEQENAPTATIPSLYSESVPGVSILLRGAEREEASTAPMSSMTSNYMPIASITLDMREEDKAALQEAEQEESVHSSKQEDQPLEEALSSFNIRQIPSSNTERRLPFERYRGHRHRPSIVREIPRSSQPSPHQELEQKTEARQWPSTQSYPGSHTYFRQVVADEQE